MELNSLNKQLETSSYERRNIRSDMGIELFALLGHLYVLDTVKNTEKNRDLVTK